MPGRVLFGGSARYRTASPAPYEPGCSTELRDRASRTNGGTTQDAAPLIATGTRQWQEAQMREQFRGDVPSRRRGERLAVLPTASAVSSPVLGAGTGATRFSGSEGGGQA